MDRLQDIDPLETREWVDALDAVLEVEGSQRAHFLLEQLVEKARRSGAFLPYSANTAYINTIPPHLEEQLPGDRELEHRLRSIVRWNAVAMVLRAGRKDLELGGHIASFASAATLYDIGFNHFWHAPTEKHGGDLIYMQGHSSPGVYARAYLEGRLTEAQLDSFRMEVDGKGIASYPHPWLMPDFWQFPTVSMGLGPIQAIYQARFLHYLQDRGMAPTRGRKVWAFMGDGEMDEPESMGAIGMAAREKLDNLVFVVNCNLQRLDGPVRGNGKIIQELETNFRGAGWNVIKVIWGGYWDQLIARDKEGILLKRMEEAVDGEYQKFKSRDGAYVREHFFGKYPELRAMVANMSDADIWRLNRGGHDPNKMYAAYAAAVKHEGQPTVILAKTVKGYGMGTVGEGKNIAHQQKKMPIEALKQFRDRFNIPIPDGKLEELPYFKPADDSPEMKYLRERRAALGGSIPQRRRRTISLEVPKLRVVQAPARRDRGGPRGLDHDGIRAHADCAGQGQEHRQVRRAHRARRVAHLRHGRIVPPTRHLLLGRATLRARGLRPADVLQGRHFRADPAGGHQRSRRDVLMDGRRDFLQQQQRADGPVLHLLFDVRDAAHRRSRVGRRRHARARLPAGRHRGPDHAQRRGTAARGRAQPRTGLGDPELPLVRPDLLLRSGGDRAGRPEADAGGPGGRVLLHHADERELPPPRFQREVPRRAS